MNQKNETLAFKVSSGLKNLIGRDLISDKYIAIFELVKNSYDANASNVKISYLILKKNHKTDLNQLIEKKLSEKWLEQRGLDVFLAIDWVHHYN